MLRRNTIGLHRQRFWNIEFELYGANGWTNDPIYITFSKINYLNNFNLTEELQVDFDGLRATFNHHLPVTMRPAGDEELLNFFRFCSQFKSNFIATSGIIPVTVENNNLYVPTYFVMEINSLDGAIVFRFVQPNLQNVGRYFEIAVTQQVLALEYN